MIGRTISHYRILQKMGGGGMGVVYKAEDLKLRRTVALKFLAPELTRDEDAKKRFLHEAQAASALDHPNICGIHEIDETPEGQLFIAMTCYDGESLKERIARRKLDVEEAFQIAVAVAQGLGRAHARDIIHRDIKPANVMITADGFVKIIDFGLSKLIGRSRVTGSGAALGTVAYMSPEQARSEEVDSRADIWALGAILYEMLTQRVPFRGEIDQAVVYSILNEEPAPIKSIRADVPEACVNIVMKCLAKNADDRYQSAEDFQVAVYEAGRKLKWSDSFAASHVRPVSVIRPPIQKPRRVWPFVAIALIAVSAAGLFAFRDRLSSPYSTDFRLAVMPFERLGDTPPQAFVDGLSYWSSEFAEEAPRTKTSMWVVPYYRVLAERPASLDRVADTFGVNRILTGSVVSFEAGHRVTLELLDANSMRTVLTTDFTFSDDSELSRGLRAALIETLSLETSFSFVFPARTEELGVWGLLAHWRTGDNASVAAQRMQEIAAVDSSSSTLALAGFANYWAAVKQGGVSLDNQLLSRSEQLLRKALRDEPSFLKARIWLSYVYNRMGRSDDQIAILRDAAAAHPEALSPRNELGWALVSGQRYDEALEEFARITELASDDYYGHWSEGWVYWKTDRAPDELAANLRAYRLAPDSYRVLNSLGLYYDKTGNITQAREFYERAFLIKPECPTCQNVARLLYLESRFKEAAMYHEYGLQYCDTTSYLIWFNLASSLYHVEGQRDKALRMYRKGIALAENELAVSPENTELAALVGDGYHMLGDHETALQYARRLDDTDDGFVQFRLAQIYEGVGDREKALHHAGDALRGGYPPHEIVNEPMLSDLVRDPRFEKILSSAHPDN